MTMTGSLGRDSWISCSNSRPLLPGMRISVINTSGTSALNASRAASACSKVFASIPLCLSARSSTQRMDASSSTSQTCRGLTAMRILDGQKDGKHSVSRHALELYEPVVPDHQILGNGQPQPASLLSSGHQRIEQCVANVRRHARAIVFELDAGYQTVARGTDALIGQR